MYAESPTPVPNRAKENDRNNAIRASDAHSSASNRGVSVDREIVIAVMGATGSGKTTFINLLSGSTLRIGKGLQSCTSVVQAAAPFELDGRQVILIDMPGFDDTTKSDTTILKMIANFLATTQVDTVRPHINVVANTLHT